MTTTCAPAIGLAAYLEQAQLVAATTPVSVRAMLNEFVIKRSFVGSVKWGSGQAAPTAASDEVVPFVGSARTEDLVIAQIEALKNLQKGWDGEDAAAPNIVATRSAQRFVRALADKAGLFEPSVHADGSILLEIDGGLGGSVKFNDDGSLSYAINGHPPATVAFDGTRLPPGLRDALSS